MDATNDRKPNFSTNIDNFVKPEKDFYEYAVGGWLKTNPIPADYSRWGSFEELYETNLAQLKGIIENPENFKDKKEEENALKINYLYKSGMDEEKINKIGYQPILEELRRIEKIDNLSDLAKEIAHQHSFTATPFFHFGSTPDSKNSNWVIAGLMQGGLGLPDRDYYLKDDEHYKKTREKYLDHLTNFLFLFGIDKKQALEEANVILSIERSLSQHSTAREELRDPLKNYHKMTLPELINLSPMFDWRTFFREIDMEDIEDIDVGQIDFFKNVGLIINEFGLEQIKIYLKWNLFRENASYLSQNIVDEQFSFYNKFLNGQERIKDRWKRVVDVVDGCIGNALGNLYIKKYFTEDAKRKVEAIVKNLFLVMEKRIENLDWMNESTKKEALIKLKNMNFKIGYPEKWIDYSSLSFDKNKYFLNVMQAHNFEFRREINKIGKPADKEEWYMHPHTINAYYDQLKNEIAFPAGILQPPFFYTEADDAVNYGGIGAVIGHEITHGFDDQGRQYDAIGNIRDWWQKADEEKFKEKTKRIIEQYNNFFPVEGQHVNGKFTLGENIADLGGLSIAYEAWKISLLDQAGTAEKVNGFSPEQMFFLNYAETWRNNIREEKLKLSLIVDPHSPGKYRVNGVVSNLEEFYQAFDIKENDPMCRQEEQRAKIW